MFKRKEKTVKYDDNDDYSDSDETPLLSTVVPRDRAKLHSQDTGRSPSCSRRRQSEGLERDPRVLRPLRTESSLQRDRTEACTTSSVLGLWPMSNEDLTRLSDK